MGMFHSEVHKQVQGGSASAAGAAFGSTTLHSIALPRTLALIATISLVAFALYAMRPTQMQTTNHQASLPAPGIRETEDQAHAAEAGDSAETQSSSSRVTVNGKDIPVPANGNLHQTITDGDTTTTVNLSSSGNGSNNSSTTVNVQSSTSSSTSSEDGM